MNFTLKIGDRTKKEFHDLNITDFRVIKENPKKTLCLLQIKDSISSFETLPLPLSLRKLKLKAELTEGRISISELTVFSNYAEFNAKGSLNLKGSKYSSKFLALNFNGKFNAKEAFSLLDMDAKGHLKLQGHLSSKSMDIKSLEFQGKSQWTNLSLMYLSLYNGTFDLNFKEMNFRYSNLLFALPDGGTMKGHGRYELYNEFFFENTLFAKDISLQQVFKVIDLDIILIDSINSSKKLEVSGHFNKYQTAHSFDMRVKADMESRSFEIPLNDNVLNPMKFSTIDTQTEMRITKDYLTFKNTKLTFEI